MANWARSFLEQNPQYAGLRTRPLRNGLAFIRPGGYIEGHFTGLPVHHANGDQIDTSLRLVSGTRYGASNLPITIDLDGTVVTGGYTHRTNRVGLLDIPTRTFTASRMLGSGAVDDDSVVRSAVGVEHRIRLTETGLKEYLTVASLPPGGTNDALVIETQVQGATIADGELLDDFNIGQYRFLHPSAHDARGLPIPCRRFAHTSGGILRLYYGIPLSDLRRAVFPIVIDPDFAGSTADTYIEGGDVSSYATARSTATGHGSTGDLYTGQEDTTGDGGKWWVYRFVMKYDTSAITAAAVVDQVNLKMTLSLNVSDARDFDVRTMQANWSSQDPISAGNRDAAFDIILAATQDAILLNTAGISADTQYTSANMDTAYVSKTGTTYYGVISSTDLSNSPPTGGGGPGVRIEEFVGFYSQDNATAGKRPVLTVLYHIPGSLGVKRPHLMQLVARG